MKFKDFIFLKKDEKKHTVFIIFGLKLKIRKGPNIFKYKGKEKHYDVGIIPFNMNTEYSNFGAALHSYAFQKYLDKHGVNSVIINYSRLHFYYEQVKINLINYIKDKNYFELIQYLKVLINGAIKQYKFDNFFYKNCRVTKYQYNIDTLPLLKKINRFVCETDVTFSTIRGKYDRAFLCDLPNMKKKDNIAYSVDFGSGELSDGKRKSLKKYAKNFKYISIRNVFKLDYFKNVIERDDVVITIDPVFLLNKEDYLKVTKVPKIKEDYLLVYNCKENHPAMLEKAKIYAEQNNLKLVEIHCYDKNIISYNDNNPTPIGIEEFLGYIKNSKCVFTNSYHGLCFSIIYQVPFFAFSRVANNEKILTILELFDLHNRFVANNIPNNVINWEKVNSRLLSLRKDSEEFIQKTIIDNKERI